MNTWINSKTRIPENNQVVWLSDPSGANYKAVFLWCRNTGHPVWRASAPTLADGQLSVEHRDWRPVEPSQWRDSREYPPANGQSVWVWNHQRTWAATFFDCPEVKDECLWQITHLDQIEGHHLWQPLEIPEPPTT